MWSGRDIALSALFLVMEVYAGFALLVGTGILADFTLPGGFFWSLLLAALSGASLVTVMSRLDVGPNLERAVLLALGIGIAVSLARLVSSGWTASPAAAGLVGIAYWRGLAVAWEPPDQESATRRLAHGFAVLFLALLWLTARSGDSSTWTVVGLVGIGYTEVGVLALGIGRAERVGSGTLLGVGLVAGLQLAVVLVIGLAGVAVFGDQLARPFVLLVGGAWDDLTRFLVFLARILISPLAGLIQSHPLHPHPLHPYPLKGHPRKPVHHAPVAPWPQWVSKTLIALAAMLAVATSIVIWLILPERVRTLRRGRESITEEYSRLSFRHAWRAILAWLRSLFGKSGEAMAGAVQTVRRRTFGPTYPDDPTRALYARLLHQASAVGVTRPTGTTPNEFERILTAQWPAGADDFAGLTRAYILRRYAETEPLTVEIDALRQGWLRVRSTMRRQPARTKEP